MPMYDRHCGTCGLWLSDVLEPIAPPVVRCPHCDIPTDRVWISRSSNVNGDACDVVQENGFHTPTRFTSKRELARALAARGLEQSVRHVTVPGTDKSPYTTDWSKGSIDAQTLANARVLAERQAHTHATTESYDVSLPVNWTIEARE